MKELHRQAVQRKRRVIFNNDGDDVWLAKEASPRGLLGLRMAPVTENTHVDTIFYCTSKGFGMFTHDTEAAEVFTRDPHPGKRNITKDLMDQGTNPLTLAIEHCRKKGIEVFSSLRMNDIHDGAGWPVFMSDYKKQHPEYFFGSEQNKPPFGYWTGVDYGQPQIREKTLEWLSEICRCYDVDGIELDFYRHFPHFKRHAWGEPVLKEELDGMTDLMRRIRVMTSAREEERGKPLLIAVRVFESTELSREFGLDILTWLEEDLIDLIVTGEVTLTPYEDLINLGHRYGVPVYPCLLRTRVYDDAERKSVESFRAQAISAFRKGADGVYTFNLFPEEGYTEVFREVGEPELLEHRSKLYCVDAVGIRMESEFAPSLGKYANRPVISPRNPTTVQPGTTRRIPIYIGDSMSGSKKPEVKLRVHMEGFKNRSEVDVILQANALKAVKYEGSEIHFEVPPGQLKTGYNLFEVDYSGSGEATLSDLKLQIDY